MATWREVHNSKPPGYQPTGAPQWRRSLDFLGILWKAFCVFFFFQSLTFRYAEYEIYVCLIAHKPTVKYFVEQEAIFFLGWIRFGSERMMVKRISLVNVTRSESWRTTSLRRALGSRPISGPWTQENPPQLLEANGDTRGCQGWLIGRQGGELRRVTCTTSPSSSSL